MSLGAFVSLEDISDALPPYREEIVSVEMDESLQKAYEEMEEDIKKALREHRGNQSIASVALNALLAYPDRPFGFGDLIGREFNPETQRRKPFPIAATRDLDENFVYAKERRLVEEIKASLALGRKVQVYAVYTEKRDVTRRLESILAKEGIRVAVLTTQVAPEEREAWYERQLRSGLQVCICHPRLVQTGLDYVEYKGMGQRVTMLCYESCCVGSAYFLDEMQVRSHAATRQESAMSRRQSRSHLTDPPIWRKWLGRQPAVVQGEHSRRPANCANKTRSPMRSTLRTLLRTPDSLGGCERGYCQPRI